VTLQARFLTSQLLAAESIYVFSRNQNFLLEAKENNKKCMGSQEGAHTL
jgi:hypothetical protein